MCFAERIESNGSPTHTHTHPFTRKNIHKNNATAARATNCHATANTYCGARQNIIHPRQRQPTTTTTATATAIATTIATATNLPYKSRARKSLQTVSNYFLLSLALADLLIGLISMPLYTLYLMLNYWPLGKYWCW